MEKIVVNSEMGLKRQIQLQEVIKNGKTNAETTGASLTEIEHTLLLALSQNRRYFVIVAFSEKFHLHFNYRNNPQYWTDIPNL